MFFSFCASFIYFVNKLQAIILFVKSSVTNSGRFFNQITVRIAILDPDPQHWKHSYVCAFVRCSTPPVFIDVRKGPLCALCLLLPKCALF
jgi:hypothetical protein